MIKRFPKPHSMLATSTTLFFPGTCRQSNRIERAKLDLISRMDALGLDADQRAFWRGIARDHGVEFVTLIAWLEAKAHKDKLKQDEA